MSNERMQEIIAALLETEGRTEAEAEAAQLKAAKLMTKIGVSREDILASNPDMQSRTLEINRFDWVVSQYILTSIETLTGTQVWYDILSTPSGKRSDRKEITWAGYRSDVDQAYWLYEHLLQACKSGSSGISKASERTSYSMGFGIAVRRRIEQLIASLKEARPELDGSTGSDLVVVRDATVKSYVDLTAGKLVTGKDKGSKATNSKAYAGGKNDGASVSLAQSVNRSTIALPKPAVK